MSIHLINANSLNVPLKAQSVHMVACSPPYWGLRNYGEDDQFGQEKLHDCSGWARGEKPCDVCFVCSIRKVAAEVWRVLRDDGTFWLNLGDSFGDGTIPELRAKDLALVPARVALALQSDGWYVRQDIVWSKTNPMSESVNGWRWERHKVEKSCSRRARTGSYHAQAQNGVNAPHSERNGREWADQENRKVSCPGCSKCENNNGYILKCGAWRPTKAHEYVFLLAKSERYYCDKYAVTEPLAEASIQRISQTNSVRQSGQSANNYDRTTYSGNEWQLNGNGRNKWSVWTLPTKGYAGAHFAVWPAELVEPMVKAGTSERGCCPHCGSQWARVIDKGNPEPTKSNPNPVKAYPAASATQGVSGTLHMTRKTETVDWLPTCDCPDHDPVPCTVLDVFCGSGTTLEKARQLGRDGIGIDLSFDYLANEAKERLLITAVESLTNGGGLVFSSSRKRPSKVPEKQMSLL